MLIASLFVFQALSASFCYDTELEGNMRVGNDLSIIREYSAIYNKLRPSMPLKISYKGKLPKKTLKPTFRKTALKLNDNDEKITDRLQKYINRLKKTDKLTSNYINNKIKKDLNIDKNKMKSSHKIRRAALKLKTVKNEIDLLQKYVNLINEPENTKELDIGVNNTVKSALMRAALKPDKTDDNIADPLQKYVNHLKKRGKINLANINVIIKKDMNINKNNTLMLKTITDDYVFMIQNYYYYVSDNKREALIDTEYAYLDMIETSWRILYHEEEKLLDDIIVDRNSSSINKMVQTMKNKIYQHSITDKKYELRYVCCTYNICRQYPAFSDYCVNLINEILRLPDRKFQQLLEVLSNILKRNGVLFSAILEEEYRVLISLTLNSLSSDLTIMKKFLAMLRTVMNRRFKVVHNGNEKSKTRNKAMKILLDIFDKATTLEGHFLKIDFNTTVSALRRWSLGFRGNIENTFEEFLKHVLKFLDYNLNNTAKKEMNVLIEIILRGTTQDEEVYKRLFKFGARFVKSDDLLSDLDLNLGLMA